MPRPQPGQTVIARIAFARHFFRDGFFRYFPRGQAPPVLREGVPGQECWQGAEILAGSFT